MIKALGYYLKENIQIALSYITRTADEMLLDVLDDICRFAVYSFQANNERNGSKAHILPLFIFDRVFQYGVKVCMANFARTYMSVQRA